MSWLDDLGKSINNIIHPARPKATLKVGFPSSPIDVDAGLRPSGFTNQDQSVGGLNNNYGPGGLPVVKTPETSPNALNDFVNKSPENLKQAHGDVGAPVKYPYNGVVAGPNNNHYNLNHDLMLAGTLGATGLVGGLAGTGAGAGTAAAGTGTAAAGAGAGVATAGLGGLGTLGALATPAAIVAGAAIGADASNKSSEALSQAEKEAALAKQTELDKILALNKEQVDTARADNEPWRLAGEQALGKLTNFDEDNPDFDGAHFAQDPSYQWRLSEGIKALQHSLGGRSSMLSGGTLKAVQSYGQGEASQEYGNAFNRYQTQKGMKLNNLQGLAGIGQTAVQTVGQAGQNYTNNAGNAMSAKGNALADGLTGAAAARASGYTGGANAINNGITNLLNQYNNSQWMSKLGAS